MTRVVLTGGSGKVGRATVKELLEHGYEVWNLDVALHPGKSSVALPELTPPTSARWLRLS